MSRLSNTLAVAFLLLGRAVVNAQHTEVTCNKTTFGWAFNSLGQSPCLVAAYLGNQCSTDDFDVPALQSSAFNYVIPDDPPSCDCSTVSYSLLMTCAACQGSLPYNYSIFSENCTTSALSGDGVYPFDIPSGTAVPEWAFQLVELTDLFNITLAKSIGDKPERTQTASTQPPSLTPPPLTSSTTPAPLPTSEISESATPPAPLPTTGGEVNENSAKNNAGAIAGAVVGGVLGLALIGALLTYLIIRERRKASQRSSTAPIDDRSWLSTTTSTPLTAGTGSSPMYSAPGEGYMVTSPTQTNSARENSRVPIF